MVDGGYTREPNRCATARMSDLEPAEPCGRRSAAGRHMSASCRPRSRPRVGLGAQHHRPRRRALDRTASSAPWYHHAVAGPIAATLHLGALTLDWPFVGLAVAGVIAGIINTLAGGGAFLTLPAMFAAGIPPGEANGSLRVAIAMQNTAGLWTFRRNGLRPSPVIKRLIGPLCIGAGLGAWGATSMGDARLRTVIGGALVVWAALLVLRPGKFDAPSGDPRPIGVGALLLTFLVGVYGGFLQAGVGFPLMALLVMYLRIPPVEANVVKVAGVLIYTLVALPVFVWADRVDWLAGTVVGGAAMVGAWIGARSQLRFGATLVRWVLVFAVAVSGVAMLLRQL
ncbi:MAG: sulfite exporter TauE/SafE family protein [Myxococcales bacterium FL481]|nr:MAG: sulfite exporter TauE/SafE family protein [Myxococcales bacterium FL481]